MGAGVKILANIINSYMANKAEDSRNIHLRDSETAKAHALLAKEYSKDKIGKVSRSLLFFLIIGTFCFMGVWGMLNPAQEVDVLIPTSNGFFQLFRQPELTKMTINGGTLLYQWWQLAEMIIGAFVVPSKRR